MENALCTGLDAGVEVFETMRWQDGKILRLDRHHARAKASCAALGLPCDWPDLDFPDADLRVRVSFAADGRVSVATGGPPAPATHWRVALADALLDAQDPWLRHKTTRRALYDQTRAALSPDIDEVLFLNQQGEVCEGTITNLFFDLGQGLSTPPLDCGLLPGTLRAELIEAGCREAVLLRGDLSRARLWVGNSLRGLIPARLSPT